MHSQTVPDTCYSYYKGKWMVTLNIGLGKWSRNNHSYLFHKIAPKGLITTQKGLATGTGGIWAAGIKGTEGTIFS